MYFLYVYNLWRYCLSRKCHSSQSRLQRKLKSTRKEVMPLAQVPPLTLPAPYWYWSSLKLTKMPLNSCFHYSLQWLMLYMKRFVHERRRATLFWSKTCELILGPSMTYLAGQGRNFNRQMCRYCLTQRSAKDWNGILLSKISSASQICYITTRNQHHCVH